MPHLFFGDASSIIATWPVFTTLVTIFYTFIHIFPFSFIRCYIFRNYLRYSPRTICVGALLIFSLECISQLLYGHIFSSRVGFFFHIIYFVYFCTMIRTPFFKQYALSLPVGVLMFFTHCIAYTVEDFLPLFNIPFLESGIAVMLIVLFLFPFAQKYSEQYIAPLLADTSLDHLWRPISFMGTALLALSILANPFNEVHSPSAFFARLAATIGSLTCMSIAIYATNQVIRQKQLNAILAVTQEMHEIEKEHYANIAEIEKNTREIQHELYDCTLRIASLLEDHNYDSIREYSQGFLDSKQLLHSNRVCGNELVNAIVSYWQNKLDSSQVKIDIHIELGADNPIDPIHMTAILGNLLRNASEALARVPDTRERKLSLRLMPINHMLVITVDNTFDGEIRQDSSQCFLSAKRDFAARGIGLDSIYHSVEQYEGTFTTNFSDHTFEASILLPLNTPIE